MEAKDYTDNQIKWMKDYVDTEFSAIRRAVDKVEHTNTDAINKVEKTYADYRAQQNEWRGTLSDQQKTYVTWPVLISTVITLMTIVGFIMTLILKK